MWLQLRRGWRAMLRGYAVRRLTTARSGLEVGVARSAARSAFVALLDHSLRRCIVASASLDARRHHESATARRYAAALAALLACAAVAARRTHLERTCTALRTQRALGGRSEGNNADLCGPQAALYKGMAQALVQSGGFGRIDCLHRLRCLGRRRGSHANGRRHGSTQWLQALGVA